MDIPCEIRLNARSIHSIDLPGSIEAAAGDTLLIRLINQGSPLHLTLTTSNAVRFTDFSHENLFLDRFDEIPVPIKPGVFPGTFDITAITGYGANRATVQVFVREPPAAETPEPEMPAPPEPRLPVSVIPFAVIAVAALLFIIYAATGIIAFEAAAFVVLVVGVLSAWYFRR
ncbi:DUF7524 family protein [Methanofollis fontis]|uniref:Uncharacterized protein n=1 Tax=Methanofollis fontis TaxID=2052832 RepID=A0A483CV41_9EURY|nr:hypothetical protein [Methanofollis fontis]TAJ45516.1 hypothetical protein CUJ86_01960 [Methanofollis fontis]